MDQPVVSLEEVFSLIEDDIRWMATAAQSFEDIAQRMPDGEEKRHIEFLASSYRECEGNRRALIEKMRRAAPG
jgi:hypothetical protein